MVLQLITEKVVKFEVKYSSNYDSGRKVYHITESKIVFLNIPIDSSYEFYLNSVLVLEGSAINYLKLNFNYMV